MFLKTLTEFNKISIQCSQYIDSTFNLFANLNFTGPLRQATGPLRSGAGVGVGMLRGAGDSLT